MSFRPSFIAGHFTGIAGVVVYHIHKMNFYSARLCGFGCAHHRAVSQKSRGRWSSLDQKEKLRPANDLAGTKNQLCGLRRDNGGAIEAGGRRSCRLG
jgi:hypothetical protein